MKEEATSRRAKRLETIRNLLARAASTEFEAEREQCLSKADDLQTKFQVEEWELAVGQQDSSARKPIRRDMDMSWYMREGNRDLASNLWAMFCECARHCRCVPAGLHNDWKTLTIPVFGLENDLDYLDLLFTNLYTQMIGKLRPQFDSSKSLGYNVYMAKEAGMKYKDIAVWVGHPEYIKYDPDRPGKIKSIDGILIREMKKYANANGLEVHQEVSLKAYLRDFCSAFVYAVNDKLLAMRNEQGQSTGSMAIALRDMLLVARDAMYDEFEDLRPHPDDCDCDRCHRCYDVKCNRPRCKAARQPIRMSQFKEERISQAAQSRGMKAGREAKIVGRGGDELKRTKELS